MKNLRENPIRDRQPKAADRPVVKKRRLTNPAKVLAGLTTPEADKNQI
jgi:hypothetical protein